MSRSRCEECLWDGQWQAWKAACQLSLRLAPKSPCQWCIVETTGEPWAAHIDDTRTSLPSCASHGGAQPCARDARGTRLSVKAAPCLHRLHEPSVEAEALACPRPAARPLLPLSPFPALEHRQPSGLHLAAGALRPTLHLGSEVSTWHPCPHILSVLGWLGWHYTAVLSQPITSMPPLDPSQSEHWATVCYNKLCTVDLRPVTKKAKRPQGALMLAHAFDPSRAVQTLHPSLVDQSGCASTLLFNAPGQLTLRYAGPRPVLPLTGMTCWRMSS